MKSKKIEYIVQLKEPEIEKWRYWYDTDSFETLVAAKRYVSNLEVKKNNVRIVKQTWTLEEKIIR